MKKYDAVIRRLASDAHPKALSAREVASLRAEFPGLPEEYLDFMSEVGWGDVTEMAFYSGPVDADDIYGADRDDLKAILLFGDNYSGDCYGFDSAHRYQIVALNGNGEIYRRHDTGFGDYIIGFFTRRQPDATRELDQ